MPLLASFLVISFVHLSHIENTRPKTKAFFMTVITDTPVPRFHSYVIFDNLMLGEATKSNTP